MKIKREIDGRVFEFELTGEELDDAYLHSFFEDVQYYIDEYVPDMDFSDDDIAYLREHANEIAQICRKYHDRHYYDSGLWSEVIFDVITERLKQR